MPVRILRILASSFTLEENELSFYLLPPIAMTCLGSGVFFPSSEISIKLSLEGDAG